MTVIQVSDIIEPDGPTPFLTFKSGSHAQTWDGVFAFNFELEKVDRDLIPGASYPVENIMLHTSGGVQTISLSQDGRRSKGISVPGRLCFYPRNQLINNNWDEPGEFIAFGVSKEWIRQVAAEVRRGDPDNLELQGFGFFDDPMLAAMGWKLLSLLQDTRLTARLYAESLGMTLAHHLLHEFDPNSARMAVKVPLTLPDQQVQTALDYIHTHYAQDLSLSEIAVAANISPAHLVRLFRNATGHTPYAYVIRYRVERAYFLFQQRKYSGAEIAQQVGFYDESHLLRHFKRIYGITPTKLLH